jgi:non-canonical purine NTP pyrophosphatase (RdgB/HAM1 family)
MLTFITGNEHKLIEVERILGCSLASEALSLEEIQSIELAPVVRHKAAQASALLQRPVLVEDTGLVFSAWNGFPGALIKWLLLSVGVEGICRLLRGESNCNATATTLFGYCDGRELQIFPGSVTGIITATPRGSSGFGWDAIFQPLGSTRTFAEMTPEEKDQFSMRRLALEQLRQSNLLSR